MSKMSQNNALVRSSVRVRVWKLTKFGLGLGLLSEKWANVDLGLGLGSRKYAKIGVG